MCVKTLGLDGRLVWKAAVPNAVRYRYAVSSIVQQSEPVSAELLGPACLEIGGIQQAGFPGAGLAMSVGRLPKRPAPLEPNEDAALLASHGDKILGGVFDGHFGFLAAEAALTVIKDMVGDGILAGESREALLTLVRTASTAIRAAIEDAGDLWQASRTALTLAIADPGTVHLSTVGDTTALLVRPRRTSHFRGTPSFLGPQPVEPHIDRWKWRPGHRLLLATDGVTDYAALPHVARLVRQSATAADAASAVVEAGLLGGAGDNATAVVFDYDWGRDTTRSD